MASFVGFLPASPRRSPNLNSSLHELPALSSTMPPRAASNRSSSSTTQHNFSPPPPISASLFRPRTVSRTTRTADPPRVADSVVALRREEKSVEDELQELLDAQSDGLFAALHGRTDAGDDASSTGTSTPTLASSVRRELQTSNERYKPRRKPKSLQAARRGIERAITKLMKLKESESRLVEQGLTGNDSVLQYIESTESRQRRLSRKIQAIEEAGSARRAIDIQNEAQKLEAEIEEAELRLRQMKVRHRQLLEEAAVTENSVQSKLSSYRAALALLENDVQTFLSQPPPRAAALEQDPQSIQTLPKNRRTLGIARDYWTDERDLLTDKARQVTEERGALKEGAVLWHNAVDKVNDFERTLSVWVQHQIVLQDGIGGKAERTGDNEPDSGIPRKLSKVIADLESSLGHAESRNWKLLVAAIGAELEALRQAANMLGSATMADEDRELESLQTSINAGVRLQSESIYLPMDSPIEEKEKSHDTQRFYSKACDISEDDDTDPQHLLVEVETKDSQDRDRDSDTDGPGPLFLS